MSNDPHLENIIKHAEKIREETVALRRYIDNHRSEIESQRYRSPLVRMLLAHSEMVMFYLQEMIRNSETPPVPEHDHYF